MFYRDNVKSIHTVKVISYYIVSPKNIHAWLKSMLLYNTGISSRLLTLFFPSPNCVYFPADGGWVNGVFTVYLLSLFPFNFVNGKEHAQNSVD